MLRLPLRFFALVFVGAALLAGALPASADTIVLKGNRMVLGTFHGGNPDEIRMSGDESAKPYARKDVISLILGTGQIKSRIEPLIAEADRLELADESVVEGRYAGGDKETLLFEVEGELRRYPVAETRRLTFGHPDPAAKAADKKKGATP
jgi:hypothetical protein